MRQVERSANSGGTRREQVTYCRICEPFCGLIATVENDKLADLRPDPDHPLSRGFACPKGIAYANVQNDPDRVLYPLRRNASGEFERVTWDEALTDIVARLRAIRTTHGPDAVSLYLGNPGALNFSNSLWASMFAHSTGIQHLYSAGSQDTNSRFVASHLLYGMITAVPFPDVDHTEFFVAVGANPVVSHGSLFSAPRLKDRMHAVVSRGGEVLVIDPRRNETAREFAWQPILPDSDAWLLLSLLQVLFAEGLADESALTAKATGAAAVRDLAAPFPPELTAARTGIEPERVRELARKLSARRSVLYGRTGTCLGSSATLVNFLLDTVNLVAGNLDVRGGAVFGQPAVPFEEIVHRMGAATYDTRRSRIGDLPEVLGMEPAANMAAEITTPGSGQIRAMIVDAGNPVLSTPNGPELAAALDELDLLVSLDLYVNETNRNADYILPATAMFERDDAPILNLGFFASPFLQVTESVVPPAGEARPEWQVFDYLMRGLADDPAQPPWRRLATRAKNAVFQQITPRRIVDALLRFSQGGDRFGLRPWGHNFKKLVRKHPHGIVLADHVEVGRLHEVVRHGDRKVHLSQPAIRDEVCRLGERRDDPDFPLYLIGMRELRSVNSWMHNVPKLRAAGVPHAARMHPDDAADLGIEHNGRIRLTSVTGTIELPVLLTTDIARRVVAIPHGWGHRGGWRTANQEGGVSYNALSSSRSEDLDPLSGMSHFSGIRIRAEASRGGANFVGNGS